MPPVGFKFWVLLYVQSVKDGGQGTWSSVKHRHSASHAPQSICAAAAALVCQSNIALNLKIAPAWLRARFLHHVYINIFIYRRIGRAWRRNLDGSPAGCDGHEVGGQKEKKNLFNIVSQSGFILNCIRR